MRGLSRSTRVWPVQARHWTVAAGVAQCVVCGGRLAVADVQPVVQQGLPRLPIPTFQETGLPDFAMPVGMATFPDGTPVPEAVSSSTGDPGSSGPGSVAQGWDSFAGQSAGSGQCVALVQAADPAVGLPGPGPRASRSRATPYWRRAPLSRPSTANANMRHATGGSSHAAIYLGQNAQGIQVLDQWAGSPAAYRTIRWSGVTSANSESAFHVVTHG